jgi:hypothetical protein
MRGYGLPRTKDLEYPDIDDIQTYGLASHVGQFPGKSGDYHGYLRPKSKARNRRIWKRKERLRAKNYARSLYLKDY